MAPIKPVNPFIISAAASGQKARTTAAMRRRLKLRKEIWPDFEESMLWRRADFVGFTTVPRTMPIIIRIINSLDKKSAGSVYFELWCRAFDDFLVEVKDEYECAFSAGYEGQRAVRTWRERVEVLEKFGFVWTKKAPHGAYRYVLMLDPHIIIEKLKGEGKISELEDLALKTQLISIGGGTRDQSDKT